MKPPKMSRRRRRELHGRTWCLAWSQLLQARATAAGWIVERVRDHRSSIYLLLRHPVRGRSMLRVSTHPSGTFKPCLPGHAQCSFNVVAWRNSSGLHALSWLLGRRLTAGDVVCRLPHLMPVHE